MDNARARELLDRERARIQREMATLERDGTLEASTQREPGDRDSEELYEDELAEGRLAELRDQLASVGRAEERLAAQESCRGKKENRGVAGSNVGPL